MSNAYLRNCSSSNKCLLLDLECLFIRPGSVNFTAFYLTSILLMFPICILVLNVGFRQWWQQHSTSTAAIMGHSDVFIYHLVVMELVAVLGCFLCIVGIWVNSNIFMVGFYFCYFSWYGEALFHILTCVERYLAVVHPITYLSLRSERGIRIRNICIGCVWLFSIACTSSILSKLAFTTFGFIFVLSPVLVISFCSVSILYILIRPGPGDKPGSMGSSNQSKMKAFYIIMVILAAVLLRMFFNLAWIVFILKFHNRCLMVSYVIWLNLPCTLVLPLLFLQRSGTFTVCMSNLN